MAVKTRSVRCCGAYSGFNWAWVRRGFAGLLAYRWGGMDNSSDFAGMWGAIYTEGEL